MRLSPNPRPRWRLPSSPRERFYCFRIRCGSRPRRHLGLVVGSPAPSCLSCSLFLFVSLPLGECWSRSFQNVPQFVFVNYFLHDEREALRFGLECERMEVPCAACTWGLPDVCRSWEVLPRSFHPPGVCCDSLLKTVILKFYLFIVLLFGCTTWPAGS